jgi:ribonuclease P protein component
MLSRINRISKQKDFDLIFKEGRIFQDENLIIRTRKNGFPFSRLAVVVSSAISKKAVIRNKIRRQIIEIFRKDLKKVKIGLDIMVVIKKEFLERKEKPKQIIEVLFSKAGLYV